MKDTTTWSDCALLAHSKGMRVDWGERYFYCPHCGGRLDAMSGPMTHCWKCGYKFFEEKTTVSISDKINLLIDSRYTADDGTILPYDKADLCIDEAVQDLMRENEVADYSIDFDIIFNSPGYDCGYLSIAYIEGGRLVHGTYVVEVK